MGDDESVRAFVRDGLVRYAAARDAVDFFETRIHEALRRTFEERRDWVNFRPALVDGQLTPILGRTGSSTRWLWGYVAGERTGGEKAWVTLGICWKPPKLNHDVVLYAALTVANGRQVNIDDRPDRDPRVRLGAIDKNERRPYLVPSTDFDPAVDFALLLDALHAGIPQPEVLKPSS